INPSGESKSQPINSTTPTTDEHGLILRYDCSITDLAHKMGVPFSAAIETTAFIPLPTVYKLNLLWINSCIDYVKKT
ncbi:hypothetical protein HZA96_00545, partial [Candidatus Woesearchaeota archaeon]|nr:hypothetical protein [Candidatus Woesearchaeota archaeon]